MQHPVAAQRLGVVLDPDGGRLSGAQRGDAERATHGVHRGGDRGGHQPGLAEVSDVELDVGTFDSDQRVQVAGLAPGEPAAELVGVQRVGVPEYRAR